ncbi:MAG TPA: SGNH/GDSL hydrolase family protein [Candidatus Brocadiia bacterium]|nr:SGNH/GDSL hydrolase family protein [Candidatus Brocadiia bacterium]
MSDFKVKDGETFVFIGDSITDCGRRDVAAPFGNGYVKMAIDLVTAKYPERMIHFVNTGISGNTVRDLRDRWQPDVIDHEPDWLSIKIGINDVHRTLFGPPEQAVDVKEFRALYNEILEKTAAQTKAKLLLVDPFYVCRSAAAGTPEAKVMRDLPGYIQVVNDMAKKYGAIQVKTNEMFKEQLKHREAAHFCPEPVHPYPNGHAVIALGVLKALDW